MVFIMNSIKYLKTTNLWIDNDNYLLINCPLYNFFIQIAIYININV